MLRRILVLPFCLALLALLFVAQAPREESLEVMTARLRAALAEDEPLVVWVYFEDKGLKGEALTAALEKTESGLNPRTADRRAKVAPAGDRLVDVGDLPVHGEYLRQVSATGARPRHTSRWLNAASFEVTPGQAEELAGLACVKRLDLVNGSRQAAIPDPVAPPVPAVPGIGQDKSPATTIDYGLNQAAMEQANVPPLHDAGLTGKGVVVGMLDTGFRTTHESLVHIPVLKTWDFINNDPIVDEEPGDPTGTRNHGTMTLSTVAADMPGSLVAPAPGVAVLLARTEHLTEEEPIEEDNWVAGLEWVEQHGADLVSSSLSYYEWYDFSDFDGNTAVTTVAADEAAARGLLVVNSSGNNRSTTGTMGAPADGFDVLTVGAVDENGVVTYFSSPGPTADGRIKPEVVSRGLNNTVAHPSDDTAYLSASGTSFSCPLVSGVVALMLERVPQLTPAQILEAVKATASQSSTPDNDLGWGIIDAWAAATWFGPVIAHDPLPDTEDVAGPYTVTANVTDRVGVDTESIFLHYRVNGGPWSGLPMAASEIPEVFQADIPGAPEFATVEYYVTATGTNGFTTALPYQGVDCAFRFTTGPWRDIGYVDAPAAPIADGLGEGLVRVINVPVTDSGFILDFSVDIDISHPDRGELVVLLTGPDGTEITLHDHSGAGLADLAGNWTGTLVPDGPGGPVDFVEENNKGDWTLEVIDNIPGNEGTLNSWGLNFTLVRYVTPVPEDLPSNPTRLGPNVPNPFNPRTEISFALARSGQTRLAIFDVRGMLVRQLIDQDLAAGPHTVVWDGLDRTGRAVGSGTYIYRLESGPVVESRKMLLVR